MLNKTNNKECIQLSVIVSVYNVEKYLDDCLRSLAEQSVQSVEFIIVDDGSTDGSSKICDNWSSRDKRFVVIHQKNKGTYLAREIGIVKSRGKRIIFLDGDDLLAKEALCEILKLIDNTKADVIQFSSRPFDCMNKKQYKKINNYLYSENRIIEKNINIAKFIFVKKAINWTLWNKIYDSKILKKTCVNICNYKCTIAEDMYKMFLISFYANTFHSCKTKPLYFYRVNSGISTKKQTLDTFINHLHYNRIISDINTFLQREQAIDEWYICLNYVKDYLYSSLFYVMINLTRKEFKQAFQLFYSNYNIKNFLPWLEQNFINRQNRLVEAYTYSQQKRQFYNLENNLKGDKKTIGIFYYRYYNGGVERVISLQIPLFIKLGYRIILFTEEIDEQLEYNLPSDVIRVQLPESYTQNRADVFLSSIKKYKISIICHHATSSIRLLFDLILLREARVHIVLTAHEMTCFCLASRIMYPFDRVAVYKLADILLTLSSSEETFYTLCGVNARYVPNPSADIIKSDIIPIKQRNLSVLWIGRLSNEKNYKEALKIFKIIVDKYVNVKCYIVGSGGIRDNIFVDFFIKFNNLNDNIIHIPYTKDVEVFYKKTYVQLVTSSFESFPMVIVEGKLYGLPLVTYDLPTVELLKDERGIVRVESHNIQEAADAVLTILKNKEYAERLSNEARESIESFFQCDQEKIWSEIFKDPCKKYIKIGEKDTENMSLFWSSLITMYHEGLVSKPSVRQQIKTLIKCILEIFFPVGSQRRRITKNVYRSTKRYLKAKCRDVVNNLGTNKK